MMASSEARPGSFLCMLAGVTLAALVMLAPGAPLIASDQVPAPAQKRPVAITAVEIHPVEAPAIPDGTIVFDKGVITALGAADVPIPEGALVIDGAGRRLYPGLIATSTEIGLVEIGAVRATRDQREVGEINPNVRAEVSVNPDSELIPVTRANGIALAVSRPSGGLISGSSALLRLDGWTWEDLVVRAPLGIEVRWPRMQVEVVGDKEATRKRRQRRDRQIAAIRDAFQEARASARARAARAGRDPLAVDLRSEALLPAIEGECPVFLHVGGEREIRAAVEWALGEGLRPVIVGGADVVRLIDFLKERPVAVIYGPVHRLPSRRDAPHDEAFTAPAELFRAGIPFAIGGFSSSNARNLPYHAAMAAAHGLPPEEALRAITLSAAQILGVADSYGSLAIGKSATLMLTDGDPLEIVTAVEALWIDGREIDLTSRHTTLNEKYAEKIRRHRGSQRF
ncbi:MAG: amidohydrolase family protein [Planctomycetota bacterium]